MNGVAGNASPCFGQPSVSSNNDVRMESDPDSIGSVSVSSVESTRDRSHLFLDPKKMRSPTLEHASPSMIPKELLSLVTETLLSPERILGLNLLQAAAQQQQQQQAHNTVAETPTPTKLIYPNNVTKAQEVFAEGFALALRQIQQQNQFAPTPSLQSPSTVSLLLPTILASLTPTASQAPNFGLSSSPLTSPVTATATQARTSEAAPFPRPELPPASSSAATSAFTNATSTALAALGAISPTVASQASPSVKSSPSTDASPLSEICKKLDPSNPSYMDFFTQHPELGTAAGFPFGMNAHAGTSLLHPNALGGGLSQHSPLSHQTPTSLPHHSSASSMPGLMGMGVKQEPGQGPLGLSNGYLNGNGLTHTSHGFSMNGAGTSGGAQYPTPTSTSSSLSFDMADDQDRKKLERKRQRNRLAASKCRQRKLERIQELEAQVSAERQKGAHLQSDIEQLQRTIRQLTEQLERHRSSGCSITRP
ncbi:CRE-JUN-1 protein [Aphelenchoides avenae]|nr:CRE-JUN-1 protein [Aphelenchus avenae]